MKNCIILGCWFCSRQIKTSWFVNLNLNKTRYWVIGIFSGSIERNAIKIPKNVCYLNKKEFWWILMKNRWTLFVVFVHQIGFEPIALTRLVGIDEDVIESMFPNVLARIEENVFWMIVYMCEHVHYEFVHVLSGF